jgi:hypothetical protein
MRGFTIMSYFIGIIIGYILCVLFPLPYINRAILDFWAGCFGKDEPVEPEPGPSGPSGPSGPDYITTI